MTRATQAPGYLCEYHVGISFPSRNVSSSNLALTGPTGITHPLSDVLSYAKVSLKHHAFTISISVEIEPRSFEQVVCDPKWRLVMQQELTALKANGTWSLQPLPLGKKPVDCKWVYKIKFKPDGTIERYKARLVVKEYSQIEGLDIVRLLLQLPNL